ncbi:MAG: glycosyltransferase family 1 protein [Lachnospiraceae bacterium]|nr:glycosyltransferase family 1 protein [Lachnospiraceae bacterium]
MIRVLQSVSNMARAGIETMLMNYYRHIDRERIQFDFIANKPLPGEYDEEIRVMGGRIFVGPGLRPDCFSTYQLFMEGIIEQNPDIKIVHGHNEAMAYYALYGAQKAGVKVRIAHAHNTKIGFDYKYPVKILCKQLLPGAATDYWACGRDAGIYYFGKKRWEKRGEIIHNAINLDRFRFDPEVRERVRREHGLEDCYLVGHVGRFAKQKNHPQLLDIFGEVARADDKARLILIGVGGTEAAMRRKAVQMGLGEKVLFLGQMANVNDWYQAFDCFVLPSLFEGLPVTGIEAQTAGLPCLFSDRVTDEVLLTPEAIRLSIKDNNEEWASRILSLRGEHDRTSGIEMVRDAGYDIRQEAGKLQNRYIEMAERAEKQKK